MGKTARKRIGILFIFKSRWLGGLYYILNIIRANAYLPEEQQPEIVLFYNKRTEKYLKDIAYTKITFVKVDVDFGIKIYLKSLLLNKNLFFVDEFTKHDLDVIFPFNDFVGAIKPNKVKLISWIPDFQHKFYPEYFDNLSLQLREFKFRRIVSRSDGLILSGTSAYKHFKQFYKPPNDFKVHIVKFTSIMDPAQVSEKSIVDEKYKIENDYFVVSNQFAHHKNHLLVLEAVKLLKDTGKNCLVIFTGGPTEAVSTKLFNGLQDFVKSNKLENNVKFLGLLSREDQLSLIKNAICVIQPSKFEGWSTVIEDAKTLENGVIASNLEVHIEQLGAGGMFFDPDSVSGLADCMTRAAEGKLKNITRESLAERTKVFALDFLEAVN